MGKKKEVVQFVRNRALFGVMRPGKTAKDRHEGQHERNQRNKAARVAWQHDQRRLPPAARNNNTFPKTSCNGKKNRHRYMGKEGKYVCVS